MNGTGVSTGDVLADTSRRAYIIQQLLDIAAQTGLDGINVDFESIREETAPQFLQFLKELCVAAHGQGLVVSVDNFVPLYTRYYKARRAGKDRGLYCDHGYDEHTASSEEIGSVASLPFVEQGITDTLEEVSSEKVINAIPSIPEPGRRSSVRRCRRVKPLEWMKRPHLWLSTALRLPGTRRWDRMWGSAETDEARYSIWLEDEQSIAEKMKLIQKYDLGRRGRVASGL